MGNLSVREVLKNSFLENFVNNVSVLDILLTFIVAAFFACIIYFIYKYTSDSLIYSKKMNEAMALISIVTTGVVLAIQSNVVVSLGMVGALSIVRFRTAIKEPRDLLFLFWSISNGIIIGSGLYTLAIALLICLAIMMILFSRIKDAKETFLLVVNCDENLKNDKIDKLLKSYNFKFNVKSRNINQVGADIVYSFSSRKHFDSNELVKKLYAIDGIESINLLNQEVDY